MGFDWEYILDSDDVEEAYQALLDMIDSMLENDE